MSKQEAGEMRNKDTSDHAKERSESGSGSHTPPSAGDPGSAAEEASEVEINDPFAVQPPESDPALREPGLFAPDLNPATSDSRAAGESAHERDLGAVALRTAAIVPTQAEPEGLLESEAEEPRSRGEASSTNTEEAISEGADTGREHAGDPRGVQAEPSQPSAGEGESKSEAPEPIVYTVTEAARAACVSVQALRQRISRGTLSTTRVVRSGRVVLGIGREELAQHYAELLDASSVGKSSAKSSSGSGESASASAGESEAEIDQLLRRRLKPLRRRLERETVARERLLGSVESLQQQLAEQRNEMSDLVAERRVLSERLIQLEDRLVVFGNGQAIRSQSTKDSASAVWIRVVVGVLFVAAMILFGTRFWSELDRRLDAHQRATAAELSNLIDTGAADSDSVELDSTQR